MDPLVTESGNVFTYQVMSETNTKRCLCIPQAKNEAAVDAVLQPCTGLQMTRSRTHGSKAIGIRKLIDGLEDKANANVTFCVPADLFDAYPRQAVEGPLDSQKYPCQQFAIAIPIICVKLMRHGCALPPGVTGNFRTTVAGRVCRQG